MSIINASDCIGYSNIVLACGTNDLRVENINHRSDIHQLVNTLQHKISQIKKLCPKSKIFVMPVLPTRIPAMNENIMFYNNMVNLMLMRYDRGICFPGLYNFLDNKLLLADDLTRDKDSIHLGSKGICRYVSCIKRCIFESVKSLSRVNSSGNHEHIPPPRLGSPEPT